MSNEFVVLLSIVVAILGGGCATWVIALLKQNEYLKAEVQFLGEEYNKVAEARDLAKENHRRNGQIAREYQVLCGDLEEEIQTLKARNASKSVFQPITYGCGHQGWADGSDETSECDTCIAKWRKWMS